MKPLDYLKAAGVAFAVMALTMALSFPMVFAYATLIEPGHPQSFYNEAALWIAPWSSHLFGPVLFFAFNYFLGRRRPQRNAIAFAVATVVLYLLIDGATVPLVGGNLMDFVNPVVAMSMAAKLAAALLGAWFSHRRIRAAAA